VEKKIILLKYQQESGKRPFDEWYAGLDFSIAVKVDARLTRLMEERHFGVTTWPENDNFPVLRRTGKCGWITRMEKHNGQKEA